MTASVIQDVYAHPHELSASFPAIARAVFDMRPI